MRAPPDSPPSSPAPSPQLSQELLLGQAAIDAQHQTLADLAHRLREHPRATMRDEVVVDILTTLGNFLVLHFHTEEAIMREIGMPAELVAAHVRAHDLILDQYAELNVAASAGANRGSAEIFAQVMEWVGRHIVEHDLEIRAYLPTPR